MESVNDLANQIGVSKTAVFQHMSKHKDKLKGHTKLIKNKKYLDEVAVPYILKTFNLNKSNLKTNYQKSAFFMLKNELDRKNKEIDNLNQELKQEQTLHLNTQQELKSVKHELKLTNSSSNNRKSHGFFWRLFH